LPSSFELVVGGIEIFALAGIAALVLANQVYHWHVKWISYRGEEEPAPRWPIFARPKAATNLHVETAALAQRILFDGRRAAAVEYARQALLRTARARKEIWSQAARTTRRNCCNSPASGCRTVAKARHRCGAGRARRRHDLAGSHAGQGW